MTNNNMIFVANWKMHGNFNDISKVKTVLNLIKNKKYKNIKIIYCPPFTLIKMLLLLGLYKKQRVVFRIANGRALQNTGH